MRIPPETTQGGTLSRPKLTVDPAGTLFSIGKTIGSVALFGPAGIASAFITGGGKNRNPCELALRGAPEGTADGAQVDLERMEVQTAGSQ